MIISHKYKFIFIKTRKTAGTSVEAYLSDVCGGQDVFTPLWPPVSNHNPRNYDGRWPLLREILPSATRGLAELRVTTRQFLYAQRYYNHISSWRLYCRVSSSVWHEYFKFCVDRNPFDKTLSHFHMHKVRSGGELTLADYFSRGNFCLNYPLYTDLHQRLLVDRVLRYESLDHELGEVFGKLGVPWEGRLGVQAKSEYRKDRTHYSEVLSNRQKDIIRSAFAMEFDLNGYSSAG